MFETQVMESNYLFVAAAAIIAALVYVFIRNKQIKWKWLQWLKYFFLTAGVLFLSIEFYSKEQYGFLIIVLMGALAFFKLIKDAAKG